MHEKKVRKIQYENDELPEDNKKSSGSFFVINMIKLFTSVLLFGQVL